MEASPLTRQPQPEVFVPKIVELYSTLFKVCPAPPFLVDRGVKQDHLS